jgi:hypothetical protein
LVGTYFAPFQNERLLWPELLGFLLIMTGILFGIYLVIKGFFHKRTISNTASARHTLILFWVAAMAFLIMTGAAVAVKRTGLAGILEMFTSRYRFVSIWSLLCAYFLWLTYGKARMARLFIGGTTLFLTVVLNVFSYYFYHGRIINGQERYQIAVFNYQHHQDWSLFATGSDWYHISNSGTKRILKAGYYQFPERFYMPYASLLMKMDTTKRLENFSLEIKKVDGITMLYNTTFQPTQESDAKQGTCLVLKNGSKTYLWPIERVQNLGKKDFLKTFHYFQKGFIARIQPHNLPSGVYQIGIFYRKGDAIQYGFSGQTVML